MTMDTRRSYEIESLIMRGSTSRPGHVTNHHNMWAMGTNTVEPENLVGIKFGGLASEAENYKLADLNLADRV